MESSGSDDVGRTPLVKTPRINALFFLFLCNRFVKLESRTLECVVSSHPCLVALRCERKARPIGDEITVGVDGVVYTASEGGWVCVIGWAKVEGSMVGLEYDEGSLLVCSIYYGVCFIERRVFLLFLSSSLF